MTTIGIVAALQREVSPLVKGWTVAQRESDGRRFTFFEKGNAVVVCGGIGAEAARRATQALIQLYQPELIISAGFAGGLQPEGKVGQILNPRAVIDASDGSRVDTGAGDGVLVSHNSVADAVQKAKLAQSYGAQAVDMEAAAVARGAEAHGVRFMACKVISDTNDFRMPPMGRFVSPAGQFQSARFAVYAALRPWLWKSVVQLAWNSAIASRALGEALRAIQEMHCEAQEFARAAAQVKS